MENLTNNSNLRMCHRNLNLHWVSSKIWLAVRGYEVWVSKNAGRTWFRKYPLRSDLISKLACRPFLAQAGRLGINNLLQLSSGSLICVADRTLYRSTNQGASFSSVFSSFLGRRPMRMGICQDSLGRVYLGEYLINQKRKAVQLWRSDDDAINWYPVYTLKSIAHIHFVQFDPYQQVLWLGTGDDDLECKLMCSQDGGKNFEIVGEGTQLCRAGSILFTHEALFWGTDIGIDHNDQPNYIMKMDRTTKILEKVRPIDGPAYYSTQLLDGTLAIGTCVEQANRYNDTSLHLYWSTNQVEWNDLRLWPKMNTPKILGPATITFPLNGTSQNRLFFNANLIQQWKYNGSLFELAI